MLVLAASLPDLDGMGLLWSVDAYQEAHHVWGHNLAAALLLSILLSLVSDHRRLCFPLCIALFHLHLLMDFHGSGQGWGIAYWWPLSGQYCYTDHAWSLGGWQNYAALGILAAWTWLILRLKNRTLFEHMAPPVDRAFLKVFGTPQGQEL